MATVGFLKGSAVLWFTYYFGMKNGCEWARAIKNWPTRRSRTTEITWYGEGYGNGDGVVWTDLK